MEYLENVANDHDLRLHKYVFDVVHGHFAL